MWKLIFWVLVLALIAAALANAGGLTMDHVNTFLNVHFGNFLR